MFATSSWFDAWLARTSLAGGAILLMGIVGMVLIRQPARRQRIGELALVSGLLVAVLSALPSWWRLDFDRTLEDAPLTAPAHPPTLDQRPPGEFSTESDSPSIIGYYVLDESESALFTDWNAPATETATQQGTPSTAIPWITVLGVAYCSLTLLFLLRCGFGYVALRRLWRRSRPAPARVREILGELIDERRPLPRLGIADGLVSPVSFGLRQPTILLPAAFCRPGQDEALRSVLVHELTHLARHDAWSCLLVALTQSVYFYVPWFWWLKRQLRLAQEFIADAAAAGVLSAVDYAQYLVDLSVQAQPRSLALSRANGVFLTPSDLSRRVDMLLKSRTHLERFAPRRWSLFAGGAFFGLAALLSGVNLRADDGKNNETDEVIVTGVEAQSGALKIGDGEGRAFVIVGDDQEGKKSPRVWIADSQDKENLERLQKALDSLKAAARKLGDDVPEEVRRQLRDVERQLGEAKKRMDARQIEWKTKVEADVIKAREGAEQAVQKARAEAERARKLAQEYTERAEVEARRAEEGARTRAMRAEEEARKAVEAARRRVEEVKSKSADAGDGLKREVEQRERDFERFQADVKRRIERIAGMENDDRKIAELDALKAVMQKNKALKDELKAKQKQLQDRNRDQDNQSPDDARRKAVEALRRAEMELRTLETKFEANKTAEGVRVPVNARVPTIVRPGVPGSLGGAVNFTEAQRFGPRGVQVMNDRLGVRVEPAPAVLASQMNLGEGNGIVIVEVRPESPVKEKLEKFDVILAIDGRPLKANAVAFFQEVTQANTAEPHTFRVLRSGRRINVEGIKIPEAKGPAKTDGSIRWVEVPKGGGIKDGGVVELEVVADQLRKVDPKAFKIDLKLNELKDLKDHIKLLDQKDFKIDLKAGDMEKLQDHLKRIEPMRFKIESDPAQLKGLQEKLEKMHIELEVKDLEKLHDKIKFITPEIEKFKELGELKDLRFEIELDDAGKARIKKLEQRSPKSPAPPKVPAPPSVPREKREAVEVGRVIEAVADTRTNSVIKRVTGKDGEEFVIEHITDRPATDVIKSISRVVGSPMPKAPAAPSGADKNVNLSISRSNDAVRIRQQKDQETIVIVATLRDGKPVPTSITIEEAKPADGKKASRTYSSLKEVDAKHREAIEELLKKANRTGSGDTGGEDPIIPF